MTICNQMKQTILENLESILALRHENLQKEDESYLSKVDLFCEQLI
jgi:hypothetical protein